MNNSCMIGIRQVYKKGGNRPIGFTNPSPCIISKNISNIRHPRQYHRNKLSATAMSADKSNINCKNLLFMTYLDGISNLSLYSFINNIGIMKKVKMRYGIEK